MNISICASASGLSLSLFRRLRYDASFLVLAGRSADRNRYHMVFKLQRRIKMIPEPMSLEFDHMLEAAPQMLEALEKIAALSAPRDDTAVAMDIIVDIYDEAQRAIRRARK